MCVTTLPPDLFLAAAMDMMRVQAPAPPLELDTPQLLEERARAAFPWLYSPCWTSGVVHCSCPYPGEVW